MLDETILAIVQDLETLILEPEDLEESWDVAKHLRDRLLQMHKTTSETRLWEWLQEVQDYNSQRPAPTFW